MALIWSVYWPTADKLGPDLDQMRRIIDVPEEVARMRAGDRTGQYPGDGTARWPTEEELTAYEATQKATQGDLTKMTKAELVEVADKAGLDVDSGATKAVLVEAIEAHRGTQTQDAADAFAATRVDIATSGHPAATLAAVEEQAAAAGDVAP